ncbi:MAG: tRNA (adenosine(37)-N6)-threonylcarbamoyltransferase complex dimerization subunit type 1 TsaB [Woeseiaceae bacterium]
MKLLALDTSSIACSVALAYEGELWERHEEQPREHTRLLVPMIRSLLEESDVKLSDLDAIVLGNGPGSFIGMRIAASVAQGLAHGSGLGVVPVSSLAAVAAEVFALGSDQYVAVTQDAHMAEVYLGVFARADNDRPMALFPERISDQSPIEELQSLSGESIVTAGDGWNRYPGLAASNAGLLATHAGVLFPSAKYLLPLGENARQLSGSQPAADLQPAYLRDKVAEPPAPNS